MLLVTLAAAVAAYLGNQFLYRRLGQSATFLAVPWWEEACKALAILLAPGTPVLLLHLLFGSLEFAYNWRTAEHDGLFIGLVTLCGHGLFGALSALIVARFGSLWWAYVMAGLAHMLYSMILLHLVLPTLGGRWADQGNR